MIVESAAYFCHCDLAYLYEADTAQALSGAHYALAQSIEVDLEIWKVRLQSVSQAGHQSVI